MKIPKIIRKNNHEYMFEKEYLNFIMYKNIITETKECFSKHELGLLKEEIPKTKNFQKIHKR